MSLDYRKGEKIMSKSISEKMDKKIQGSILEEFLGSDNVTDMKKRIVDVIVNQVKADFSDDFYFISPDNVAEEVYEEIVNEVRVEIKPIIKNIILKKALKEYGLEDDLC